MLFSSLFVNSLHCASCALIVRSDKVGAKFPWCDKLFPTQITIEAIFYHVNHIYPPVMLYLTFID